MSHIEEVKKSNPMSIIGILPKQSKKSVDTLVNAMNSRHNPKKVKNTK